MDEFIDVTTASAAEAIARCAREERISGTAWRNRDTAGNEITGVIAAIDPRLEYPGDLPDRVMPGWLVEAVSRIFFMIPDEEASPNALKFAEALLTCAAVDRAAWELIRLRFLANCVTRTASAADALPESEACRTAIRSACAIGLDLLTHGGQNPDKEQTLFAMGLNPQDFGCDESGYWALRVPSRATTIAALAADGLETGGGMTAMLVNDAGCVIGTDGLLAALLEAMTEGAEDI
jgi:hypothetical protein